MRTILLVLAWLWVAVPLSWGVWQSVRKAAPLFRAPAAPKVTVVAVGMRGSRPAEIATEIALSGPEQN